jgi:signal transduction histidine kinase
VFAPAFDHVAGGWPCVLAIAAIGVAGVREARRRAALNEALHEVRRPLQVLALTAPVAGTPAGDFEGPVRMAAAALERLEREINGGGAPSAVRATVAAAPLLAAAVGRWQARAGLAGRSLELRCRCGTAAVSGSPGELAQALDNLLANAIEHGGSRILVTASAGRGALRIVVSDSGRGVQQAGGRRARSGLAWRIGAGERRGHGLRIVRRIAAEHGGSFGLRSGAGATEAVLELPLEPDGTRR